MPKNKIEIKTTNGKATVTRSADTVTIEEERTCFGFNEKTKTIVKKLDDTCVHFAFGTDKQIIDTLKNN
jgi:aromatic ring-opening dioxygenase LigB subunit